jgi:hypothetical protein
LLRRLKKKGVRFAVQREDAYWYRILVGKPWRHFLMVHWPSPKCSERRRWSPQKPAITTFSMAYGILKFLISY